MKKKNELRLDFFRANGGDDEVILSLAGWRDVLLYFDEYADRDMLL